MIRHLTFTFLISPRLVKEQDLGSEIVTYLDGARQGKLRNINAVDLFRTRPRKLYGVRAEGSGIFNRNEGSRVVGMPL